MLFTNFNNLNRLFFELDDLFHNRSDKNEDWERKTYVSDNGLFSYTYLTKKTNSKGGFDDLKKLEFELEECVEKQDFEKAVELRDKISKLKENKDEIIKLNKELSECVKKQDFENAITLRDKIKSLK